MATKTFLKNINVNTAAQANNLVTALEKSEQSRGAEVKMSRAVNEVRREQAKDFTAKIRW